MSAVNYLIKKKQKPPNVIWQTNLTFLLLLLLLLLGLPPLMTLCVASPKSVAINEDNYT